MKRLILLLLFFMPYLVFSQKAKLDFDETSHNFGTINENAGKATHDFTFTNTGNAPLILTNVRAGCGCTTPEWNRQPVAPGEKGTIKISFDPRNRPGSFIKSITVNSNAENPVISLTVRGNVSRKPVGPYDAYKFAIGAVKMTANSINLGAIKNTQQIDKTIEIINSDNQPATISVTSTTPGITVSATPATLPKGQKGKIELKYDAQKRNAWDFVTDKINLKVNNKENAEILVTASISEDFSQYKNNFEQAPVITLSEKTAELADLPKNSSQTHDLYIQNDGKSELIIRKIKTSDENVSVHLAKSNIKPGKKIKATVNFKTGNSSKMTKIIQFISNDPKNSIATYKVTTR